MTAHFACCPNGPLAQLIQAFWQTEGFPHYGTETILPKGVVEIIFSFAGRVGFSRSSNQSFTNVPRCFINGFNDGPLRLRTPRQQAFFGVVLQPAAPKQLFRVPCGALLNTVTDLELINPEFGELWHRLAAAPSFEERVTIVRQWLLQKIGALADQELALSAFLSAPLQPVSVKTLASEFCYSPRQLHRKTRELFGMSTEALIQYKRYVHALQLMHRGGQSLTRIGYNCHYYDQAHFIREFKDYTGLTPGQYRQQKSRLVGHLFQ